METTANGGIVDHIIWAFTHLLIQPVHLKQLEVS